MKDFYNRFINHSNLQQNPEYNPYYPLIQGAMQDWMIIDHKHFINLASNNYLGLACDDRVKNASIGAIEKYGASMCGTPIATGYTALYQRLEKRLAQFVGLESAVLLPSCYQANNGLFRVIADRNDLIVVDHYAHSSLIEGIKAVQCKIRPFLHNDMEHLEQILKYSSGYNKIFVVTESVFSTDGTVAPFGTIVALCERYGAVPVVDDSHGIGVIGKKGQGILEDQGITHYQGIYTASLGKSIANAGGMIAGKQELIDYLHYYCPQLVYSTVIPPAVLGGIDGVLDIIENEFEAISSNMWHNKEYIYRALLEAGYEVVEGRAPINSIRSGNMENTFQIAKNLFRQDIISTAFVPPSVPINDGRIRLIAGANISRENLERAVAAIKATSAA